MEKQEVEMEKQEVDGWIDGWMDGWVDGWVDGWMDAWMDGWMHGWISPECTRQVGLFDTHFVHFGQVLPILGLIMLVTSN